MGNSSSTQPVFRVEFHKSRWRAGDTVSGRVIADRPTRNSSTAPTIQSLRIQFRAEERVCFETSRVVVSERPPVGTVVVTEDHLREPLLEPGYTRVTIEADQATSGPPPRRANESPPRAPLGEDRRVESRRRDGQAPRRPMPSATARGHTESSARRGDQDPIVTRSSGSARRPIQQFRQREPVEEHEDRIQVESSYPRASSREPQRPIEETASVRNHVERRSHSQVDSVSSRREEIREPRSPMETHRSSREHRGVCEAERVSSRTRQREERTLVAAQRREQRALEREERRVQRRHRDTVPPQHPSFREERFTDTATHTIFESDSLLMNYEAGIAPNECPFGWTLPTDAPSSFRWNHGSTSVRIVYTVAVYAVTTTGDEISKTIQEFQVDSIPSPHPLVADPQDLAVMGCCSNKGVVRMGLRGASDTASIGGRFPVNIQVDDEDCRAKVRRCLVGIQETIQLRTAHGTERCTNRPVNHSTSSLNCSLSMVLPNTILPSYHGRWIHIQHSLSLTAITSGCCTNDPVLTTPINVATTAAVQPILPEEMPMTAPVAIMTQTTTPLSVPDIPEATVVTVVSDDEEVAEKAIPQPPDSSNQFNPTAPEESLRSVV